MLYILSYNLIVFHSVHTSGWTWWSASRPVYHAFVLSLVLPTYNEAANLPILLERLSQAGLSAYEVIVVDDDSPDHTWETAQRLTASYPQLRVIRRIGRRGLASAVTEGFAIAGGDVLAVMDSDLQHDPSVLTELHAAIERGADIAVASRYREGGSVGDWVKGRRFLSKASTAVSRWLSPPGITDPLSGFFAVRSSSYNAVAHRIRPAGFKILLEILAALPRTAHTAEVPLHFLQRHHGESKLSARVGMAFILQVLRLSARRIVRG